MDTTMPVSLIARTPALPRLLTPREVAELIGASERTVRRLAQDGTIHRIRLGHRTSRYTARSVQKLIDPSNETCPPGRAGMSEGRIGDRNEEYQQA
jgi:excisionase family DNA binding protein